MKLPQFNFLTLIKRFVFPYKWYVVLNILCNILSTVFSLFSFALIIPILEILFKTTNVSYTYMPFEWSMDVIKNNAYWWVSNYIETNGALNTLFLLGAFLVILTFFKTEFKSCHIRCRDILRQIKRKRDFSFGIPDGAESFSVGFDENAGVIKSGNDFTRNSCKRKVPRRGRISRAADQRNIFDTAF